MTETKKILQRWDCHHEYIEKVEGDGWGDWVSYDDAAALITENDQLRTEIARLREERERMTRERAEARATLLKEASEIIAAYDASGCECEGHGCYCGNIGSAADAAAAATARYVASKLRACA